MHTMQPIGVLTDRVMLQRKNSVGFETVGTMWARVRNLSSRAGNGTHTHHVTTRFRTDVREGDRFVYRGRALVVDRAEDLNGRRSYLSALCNEEQS